MFAETLKGSGTTYNEINFRASATGNINQILVMFVMLLQLLRKTILLYFSLNHIFTAILLQ